MKRIMRTSVLVAMVFIVINSRASGQDSLSIGKGQDSLSAEKGQNTDSLKRIYLSYLDTMKYITDGFLAHRAAEFPFKGTYDQYRIYLKGYESNITRWEGEEKILDKINFLTVCDSVIFECSIYIGMSDRYLIFVSYPQGALNPARIEYSFFLVSGHSIISGTEYVLKPVAPGIEIKNKIWELSPKNKVDGFLFYYDLWKSWLEGGSSRC